MDKKANLSSKGISAVFWGGFGSVIRTLLQIGTQVVLARLLGPVEYGIFAIATVILTFSKFFSDIGISYGLIQKKEVSDDDIRFVFTWQVVIGLVVATVVFFLSHPLAGFFNEQRLVDVIQVSSVICLLNAISSPSLNLLKRDLDFKSIQASQLSAYVIGYVFVGIPMAMAGHQVWALIGAFITTETLNFFLLYRHSRHPIGILFKPKEKSDLLSYGFKVLATNIINWIINNIDRVLIGRMFPAAQVGLYSLSYNLVSSPALTIIGVIQSALFSASARVQDDHARLRRALLTMIGVVTLLLFPVFAGIAAASDSVLHGLYGEKWLAAAELLRPIALAMPLYLLLGMATPLLWVSGHTHKEFVIQIPVAIGFVAAAALAATISLEAVAWTVFAMYFIRAAIIVGTTCRALKITMQDLFSVMAGGLVATVTTALAIIAADLAARQLSDAPIAWLIADVAAGGIGLLSTLVLFPRLVDDHVAELFGKVASRLPARTGEWVQRLLFRGQLKRSV
ncbi:Membrane protein involved in the export of O-antigen and teichoic acid [Noviherbaspirillum humi]|uniref:Membrane protein involved in the export of O-antigen and teichoic acid n=1 Tax=Noviherbaspirillum humi TaxID=1688639 RepID=A0A239GZS5_9BURK|nr:lipopolysaccharide biosynthesis protein [Noviherbaspirillum humi]SNS74411.1 Membrane protein involved in the export of O-antigen and teichoic acid [Noviherbaspirillum humi]